MYDEVTFWFVFRSLDGTVGHIEDAHTLMDALALVDKTSFYRKRGLVLSHIVASLNSPIPGVAKEQDCGNA